MSSQYSVNMDVILRCLVLVLTTLVAFTAGSATTATTSTSQETQHCKINSDCPQTRRCLEEKCSDPCPGKCGNNTICEVIHHQPFCLCKDGFTGCPYTGCHPSDMDTGRVAGDVRTEHCRPCTPCEVCQPRQVEVAKPKECKKSYLLIDERSSWYEAMAECKMRGQRLATIKNIEEWNRVKRELTLKTSDYWRHTYWTAGMGIKSTGSTGWASTWEPFNFTSWRDGEPRFLGNIYCVAIDRPYTNLFDYGWISINCSLTKYFICEKCLNQ
ncbi:uncharacterized protein LOC124366204 [Homalodisca vitripennis]|uniref:uncharacterized protein LOC124366204 n=1 Tax=Homalodisca vitripennis TaxID=197043 RepID=UPI001EEC512F|nr:uncharacterized protein LOC124366204 [Homalodisca vitripennis]